LSALSARSYALVTEALRKVDYIV